MCSLYPLSIRGVGHSATIEGAAHAKDPCKFTAKYCAA